MFLLALVSLLMVAVETPAQVNVLTAHNDIARTGQNLSETLLTPSTVNMGSFGKLFSLKVNGQVFAQPLYASQITIPGKGVHNVVYVGSMGDNFYAFDGDNNGGINASPLWQISFLTNTTPAGTFKNHNGVLSTPTIDLSSGTIYVVSSEVQNANDIYRVHALDITTGAEKFGGPVVIQGSVPGTGSGSTAGVLTFDPNYQVQRPGLLLLNGVLYTAFGSVDDMGTWHGWIFSYNAATMQQIDVFCTSPNGSGGGIWESGAGLAAEVNDPSKPYGRMFFSTGNGSFTATPPYTDSMSYGMSFLDLDLTGGVMTVADEFTPFNQAILNAQDADLGSGGPVLLPSQMQPSGMPLSSLVEVGKTGDIYLLNRNNLGGFNTGSNQNVQTVQTPRGSQNSWGAGIWGSEAYWNQHIYYGGTKPGSSNSLQSYSFVNGILSTTPTSQTSQQFSYPGPTPSISANGSTGGILWALTHGSDSIGSAVLLAYDATNLASLLYSSNANLSRDDPGAAVKFVVPTIANGRVYVGANSAVAVFGLLGSTPTVASPVITPPSATFTTSQAVSITDATAGAKIYYTLDGTIPTVSSKLYKGPITVTTNTTVTAIASATGYLQGAPVSAVFTSTANAANPTFSLAPGSYAGPQTLTITDASTSALIYYTVDGTIPTTSSTLYSGPFQVPVSEKVQAMATAPGLLNSSVVSAAYTISPVYTFDFSQGFAQAQSLGQIQFNGSTALDDFRLQLTNGGVNQAGSAFYTQKVNIQAFTTDFTFQLSNPAADGITFTIQNSKLTALGANGSGLGYTRLPKSVAIKFDFFSNAGEGKDSTGLYINGASPTVPSIDLTGTGIDLRDGDYFDAHVTYDGTNLSLTLTDAVTLATWSHLWTIDIPTTIGGTTAWVGFTGSTGKSSASQKLTYWTYLAGQPPVPSYPIAFDATNLALNGNSAITAGALRLTDGGAGETSSAFYTAPVNIDAFTTDFDLKITPGSSSPLADGVTMVLQNVGLSAIGQSAGGLGYAGLPASVAIKFDVFDNGGEGVDSTGSYVNGAAPMQPSFNLTTTGVNLTNGNTMHVHVVYDGTTLSWTIHDLVHRNSTTKSAKLNIPSTIGSNIAYIGFTAASGDGSAIQSILDWTFTNP